MVAVLALQPDAGRAAGRGYRFTDETGGHDARLHNLLAVAVVVSAVDAAAGKIDDHIRPIQLGAPGAMRRCIPLDGSPRRLRCAAADRDDILPGMMKGA